MNVSRNFLLMGVVYLVVGIGFGGYMGATGDHTLAPVHAHINLLGFTLMSIFGLIYRVVPSMGASGLARLHFWLHQIGTLVLLVALFLLMTGRVDEAAVGPFMPILEGAIMLGVLVFGWNLLRNGEMPVRV